MNTKEIQAWRTIVAILRETGYDKLYDEEVHIVAECLHRCEQQCKKQKEVTDKLKRYINGCLEVSPIEDRSVTDDVLDKEFKYLLKILNEVSE